MYLVGNSEVEPEGRVHNRIATMMTIIPVRLAAVHLCLERNVSKQAIRSLFVVAIGLYFRVRLRIHEGKQNSIVSHLLLRRWCLTLPSFICFIKHIL